MQRSREEAERNELREITSKRERSKRNVHNFEHLSPREARRSRAEVEEQSINSRGNQLLTPRERREIKTDTAVVFGWGRCCHPPNAMDFRHRCRLSVWLSDRAVGLPNYATPLSL